VTRYHVLSAGAAAFILAGLAYGQGLQGKRLVGDYGYWSRTQTPPYSSAQIPFGKLTHINHAGVNFVADGSLSVPDGFLEPELLQKAHAAGVKVLLLLGGDFTALEPTDFAPTPSVLATLLQNLQIFLTSNGYDGVDIDWEYPSSSADQKAFHDLMVGLRQFFPAPRYVLSADVAPWAGSGYDFSGVEPVVDYFNVMMYDCAGPWTDDGQLNSAIFLDPRNPEFYECNPGGSVAQTTNIFLNYVNIPPSKVNMGTPFYGYLYTNVTQLYGPCNPCNGQTVLSAAYGTFIKQRINQNGWQAFRDEYALVPYMLRTDGQPGYITYDDSLSTYTRVWYSVWQRGLGGTFMWSLDQDYDGHSQDLLDAMYQATLKQPLTVASQ
jgi:chitinase